MRPGWVDWASGQKQGLNISFPLLGYLTLSKFLSISGLASKFPITGLNKGGGADPLEVKWGPPRPGRMVSLVLRVIT